ncbi:Nephrocystin-3 [Arthrobotrys entomopaga]|nr:Nephrocystin-3 [Arthrobotrys entomopaga]
MATTTTSIQKEQLHISLSGDNNQGLQIGFLQGNVYIQSDGEQNKQPDPFSTAPLTGREYFTGRESILQELERQLLPVTGSHHRVALVGKGGVGKTQIAIEFCARLRENYSGTWVIWVDASSEASFKHSFEKFALQAEITEAKDPKSVDILDVVSRWLQANGPWLIVIDNNDDADFLFKEREAPKSGNLTVEKSFNSYLPESDNGAILITTRDAVAGQRLCNHRPGIDIQEMLEMEAVEFFSKYGESDEEHEYNDAELQTLLKTLEHLPLAIIQAKAYILEKNITMEKYIRLLSDCESNFVDLLGRDLKDGRPARSVMKTWIVSFELIKNRTPKAVELLSLTSFLHHADIPLRLLADEKEAQSIKFTDAIGELKAFRFVTASEDELSLSMHRLVQVATKEWLDETEILKYSALALEAVDKKFPDLTAEEEPAEDALSCSQLFLHADAVLNVKQAYPSTTMITKAHLLHYASLYASDQGYFSTVERWMEEAVEIRKKELGFEDIHTLYSLNNLAMAYSDMGKLLKAVETQKVVVEKFEILPDEKSDWLGAMSQLANMYMAAGSWNEAEKLAEKAVELSDETEEPEDAILPRKIALAEIYKDVGRFSEAQKLAEDVVRAAESNFEPDDPRIFSYTRILAIVYLSQGRLKEATEKATTVMNAMEKEFGKDHPDTMDAASDLALIYEAQGEFQKAQALGESIIAQSNITLGPNHPSTLTSLSNLSLVYEKMGKLVEAEKLCNVTVTASKSILGETNLQTMRCMGNLAQIYRSRGKYKEATNLGKKVLQLRRSALREKHPDITIGILNLAQTYVKQAKFDEIRQTLFVEVIPGKLKPKGQVIETEEVKKDVEIIPKNISAAGSPNSGQFDIKSSIIGLLFGLMIFFALQQLAYKAKLG